MIKGVKGVITVKGDYVGVRVVVPKMTYKALKIKCTLMDISVKKAIIDLVEKWVKDVRRDVVDIKTKG